jgi:hypothetical protein
VGAGQDHLERDRSIEPEASSLVDDAHAAAAQLVLDLIARDYRAEGEGFGCRCLGTVCRDCTGARPGPDREVTASVLTSAALVTCSAKVKETGPLSSGSGCV